MSEQTISDEIRSNRPAADRTAGGKALAAGGVAAVLASACCLGPLALVSLGFSGAWLGNFKMFEPFRPLFLSAAAIALFVAWRRIYRPAVACKAGEVCAAPQVRSVYKALFWGVAALIAASTIFPYVLPLFY